MTNTNISKELLETIKEVVSTEVKVIENCDRDLVENSAEYFTLENINYCIERLQTEETEGNYYYITLADESIAVGYVKEVI